MTYSPWNFLYFCDVALLVTAVAIWIESPLLISMQAVAITVPQMLWVVDLLCGLIAGVEITGVTSYMLDSSIPLFSTRRSRYSMVGYPLSCYGCSRVWVTTGERLDCRPWPRSSILLVSYLFAPAPPPSASHPNWAVNINYVYGINDKHPQTLWRLGFGCCA